ncbi:MAG TPA: hypothetical protein VGH89_27835, partial [Pseudonocardia sp.]
TELREWVDRAGIVAGYRELRAIPTTCESIGPAPAHEQVLHRALWQHAHTALGPTIGDEFDYTTATDAQLRQMREHYQRELAWAPYHVQEELRDARLVATGYHHDAILWQAEAQQLTPGTPERATADADVTAAQHLAARYDARIEHLQVIATARERWHHNTEHLRARHILAGEELTRRGLSPQPSATLGEQTTLFRPTEHDTPTGTAATPQPLGRGQPRPSAPEHATEAIETALATTHTTIHRVTDAGTGTDLAQGTLFAALPQPTDIAAAEPLREPAAPPDPRTGTDTPVTLAQARRHAEITAELRAQRDRWTAALKRVLDYTASREALDTDSLHATHRRTHAELHHQQLQQTLGRDNAEDLDAGLTM